MKLRKISLLIATLTTSSVHAYDAASPDWTTIKNIYSPVVGKPYISFDTGSMPGCYADRGGYIPTDKGEASQRVYSTILAAFAAQKELKVYFNFNTVNSGYNGWGLCDIEAVYLR